MILFIISTSAKTQARTRNRNRNRMDGFCVNIAWLSSESTYIYSLCLCYRKNLPKQSIMINCKRNGMELGTLQIRNIEHKSDFQIFNIHVRYPNCYWNNASSIRRCARHGVSGSSRWKRWLECSFYENERDGDRISRICIICSGTLS